MARETRVVFGAMTGTSLDGVDVAAIAWPGDAAERPSLLAVVSAELGAGPEALGALCRGEALSAGAITTASQQLAASHIAAFRQLRAIAGDPDLIAVHGQTVFHEPPRSWQLLNPWPIASAFGVPVVSDLRGLDLACDGQGAPITPLSDMVWFGEPGVRQVVLNLGGFANATLLSADGDVGVIEGFDICACNHVLNGAARQVLDEPFDRDGGVAARGKPSADLTDRVASLLRTQATGGRSLGSQQDLLGEVFNDATGRPEDVLASALHAVATVIGERVRNYAPDRVVVAGGGAKNRTLLRALEDHLAAPVVASSEFGMPLEAREAAAIATLGAMAAGGKSITLPGVTGRVAAGAPLVDGLWCLARTNADGPGVWRPR